MFFTKFIKLNVLQQNIESVEYKDTRPAVFNNESALSIKNCLFHNLKSFANGGAIEFIASSNEDSSLHVCQSSFDSCFSYMIGGALYSIVPYFSINESCFYNCTASSCHAFCLRGECKKGHRNNMNVFFRNGKGKKDQETAQTKSTMILANDLNFSRNRCERQSAGYFLGTNYKGGIFYSNFFDNIGTSIFDVESWQRNVACGDNNFVNNTASLGYKSMIQSKKGFVINRCIFSMNALPLLYTSPEVSEDEDERIEYEVVDCSFSTKETDNNFIGIYVKTSNCTYQEMLKKTYEISSGRQRKGSVCFVKENISFWCLGFDIRQYVWLICLLVIALLSFNILKRRVSVFVSRRYKRLNSDDLKPLFKNRV